jgi:hypothetical protein
MANPRHHLEIAGTDSSQITAEIIVAAVNIDACVAIAVGSKAVDVVVDLTKKLLVICQMRVETEE